MIQGFRRSLAAVIFLACAALPSAPASAYEVFFSVDDYMAASREERLSFLAGVYDTFSSIQDADLFASKDLSATVQRIIDCTSKMNLKEMETLFTAWLEKHREEWDSAAASLFVFTFDDYCK